MSWSSRASLSSCACCLLRATCAAITRCRSAISVHLAHTQSLQWQKRLWPFSADTTPWFLHLAHLGVRGYPLSSTGLHARKKRGDCRRDCGTGIPPSGLAVPSGLIRLSIFVKRRSRQMFLRVTWPWWRLARLYCSFQPALARLKSPFSMKPNTPVTPPSTVASLSCLFKCSPGAFQYVLCLNAVVVLFFFPESNLERSWKNQIKSFYNIQGFHINRSYWSECRYMTLLPLLTLTTPLYSSNEMNNQRWFVLTQQHNTHNNGPESCKIKQVLSTWLFCSTDYLHKGAHLSTNTLPYQPENHLSHISFAAHCSGFRLHATDWLCCYRTQFMCPTRSPGETHGVVPQRFSTQRCPLSLRNWRQAAKLWLKC